MHKMSLMLSIAGDIQNQIFLQDITVPELVLLRAIHGADSAKGIDVSDAGKVDHREERDRLKQKYPKQARVIESIWRDYGGHFPHDIRDVEGLSDGHFASAHGAATAQADEIEEAVVEEVLKESESTTETAITEPPGATDEPDSIV